jgi:hypothetical protein
MASSVDPGSGPCAVPFGLLIPGVFVRRENRFRVQVDMGQGLIAAHLPNSGRLGELLVPGGGSGSPRPTQPLELGGEPATT